MGLLNGQVIDESDFPSVSAGSLSAGKSIKLGSEGRLDNSFINNPIIFENDVVFNSTPPSSYTDLDLSSVVGARQSLVYLLITNSSSGESGAVLVLTDAAGIVEWRANDNGGISFRTNGSSISTPLTLDAGLLSLDLSSGTGSLSSNHEIRVLAFW